MSDIKQTIDKLKFCVADSRSPIYGSDIVPWICDLIENTEAIEAALAAQSWRCALCGGLVAFDGTPPTQKGPK